MTVTKTKTLQTLRPANGSVMLRGVYRLKDQEGFPIDASYELAEEKGWQIDWVEALADAGSQSVEKQDALLHEIKMLQPDLYDMAYTVYKQGHQSFMQEGDTYMETSQRLYNHIHRTK